MAPTQMLRGPSGPRFFTSDKAANRRGSRAGAPAHYGCAQQEAPLVLVEGGALVQATPVQIVLPV